MYEKHFGLNSRPFGANAKGAAVFVGPEQSKSLASIHKGLNIADAVIAVTGPVGCGKSTLINRALETVPNGRMVASIGRMQLAPADVLDLLLAGFGVAGKIEGSIRKFAAFRRVLQQTTTSGVPVAIVVEDAQRMGVEVLVELEALTAADSGDGASANIILMGQSDIYDFLSNPNLARLKQRVRLRQTVNALSAPEVLGYLKHCIRTAGGEYAQIFDDGVAEIVFACSEGIPRVINTLCEAALAAAMDENSTRVSQELMSRVAVDTFGFDTSTMIPVIGADSADDLRKHEPVVEAIVEPEAIEVTPVDTAATADAAVAVTPDTYTDAAAPMPIDAPADPDDVSQAFAADTVGSKPAEIAEAEKPAIGHDIVVESGRYPNHTDPSDTDVIATASFAVEPADADDSLDMDTPTADSVDADIPTLIDDTQPKLRTLPELTDETARSAILNPADPPATETSPREPDYAAGNDPQPGSSADGNSAAEAAGPAPLASQCLTESPASSEEIAADESSAEIANDEIEDEVGYDLDAALAVDVDATNIQEVLTPDLDAIATDTKPTEAIPEPPSDAQAEPVTAATQPEPVVEFELPTLSDSMRVAVAKNDSEVLQEEQAESALPEPETDIESVAETDSASGTAQEDDATIMPEREIKAQTLDVAPSEIAAAMAADDDAGSDTGIFEDLDPDALSNSSDEPEIEDASIEVPELTIANNFDKSKNDIDALEAALDAAKQGKASAPAPFETDAVAGKDKASADDLPQITLDSEISNNQPDRPELDKIAAEISNAASLEDFSASMAETLFGSEAFDEIAAAVVANPPQEIDNPVMLELENTSNQPTMPEADGQEVTGQQSVEEIDAAPPEPPMIAAAELVDRPSAPAAANGKAAPANFGSPLPRVGLPGDVPLNESVAMRIEILNKAKQNVANMAIESVELGDSQPLAKPRSSLEKPPEAIEDQINTSITQTLKALDMAKMAEAEAAKEKTVEKKSGGLFSRFRKSS